MTTPQQTEANKRNARSSTGPRTPAGKSVSRWNAVKHGLLARSVIPPSLEPYESRAEFDSFCDALREEYAPATVVEALLVERIAADHWRLARLFRAEAAAAASCLVKHQRARADRVAEDRALADALQAYLHDYVSCMPTPIQLEALRDFMVELEDDDNWQDYADENLLAAVHARLAELRGPSPFAAENDLLAADLCSLPPIQEALLYARYESMLEHQLHRAMATLERLQQGKPTGSSASRAGDPVPPPYAADPDPTGPSGPPDPGVPPTTGGAWHAAMPSGDPQATGDNQGLSHLSCPAPDAELPNEPISPASRATAQAGLPNEPNSPTSRSAAHAALPNEPISPPSRPAPTAGLPGEPDARLVRILRADRGPLSTADPLEALAPLAHSVLASLGGRAGPK